MFVPIKGLLYLDILFLLLGLLTGLLAGFVFGRFVPSQKLTSIIDLGVAALASFLAIFACAWISRRTKWSFDQLMVNQLWACIVGSLILVLLWRIIAYSVHRHS